MNTENLLFELRRKNIIDKINGEYIINPSIDLSTMDISLGFDNVAIQQGRSRCDSRLDANIESEVIRGIKRPIPLIASNMSTVVDSFFCTRLYNLGALGVMHRALPEEELLSEIKSISEQCDIVCASVGSGNDQVDLAKKIIQAGANVIFIDIAHGYSQSVIDTAKAIKKYSSSIKVVVGNTTNINMLIECQDVADGCKVGLSQGFSCKTKDMAACAEQQFSAVYKFKYLAKKYGIPIISDGGVRKPADFVKSTAAGANSVMAGKIFAACPESGGRQRRCSIPTRARSRRSTLRRTLW